MRSKKYLMYGILVVLVISIGVSYSYFVSKVENKNGELSINSKEINIIFTDTTEISEESITPGWSTSKSFSVENKSEDTFNYNIVLEDLINTFETVGNLQYKITSSNGYNMDEYADIPKSKEAKDIILAYDIDIEKDVKQEYTIEFIYKNSSEDQSIDMNKEFSGILAITEGSIDPNKKYLVTIELENGIITSENPQESLKKGSLTYTYELNEGYEINGTEVICSGSAKGEITEDNIIIRDIREDQVCTISPSKKKYIVDIKVNNGSSDALNKHIEYLGSDIFNITPNYGYTLSEVTVTGEGCTIEGSVVTVSNVTSNRTCEVTLKKDKYNVYLSGANISVDASPKLVEYEESTTFIVTPSIGFTLDNSVINCDNGATSIRTNNNVTVSNITRETRCEITPVQLSYNVTLVMNNGSVSGSAIKTVNHGGRTTFNVSVNSGYNLTNPSITCTGSALGSINGNTMTISNITVNKSCTVTFEPIIYTVTVNVTNGTYSGNTSVAYGQNGTYTITPNTGYKLDGASVSGTGCSLNGSTLTVSNVQGNRVCNISLPNIIYTLTVNVNDTSMGSVSPNPATTTYGGSYVVTITPKEGYTYTTDCGVTPVNNQLIWNNVTWDGTCNVNFEKVKYIVYIVDEVGLSPIKGSECDRTLFSCPDNPYGAKECFTNLSYGSARNYFSYWATSLGTPKVDVVSGKGSVTVSPPGNAVYCPTTSSVCQTIYSLRLFVGPVYSDLVIRVHR